MDSNHRPLGPEPRLEHLGRPALLCGSRVGLWTVLVNLGWADGPWVRLSHGSSHWRARRQKSCRSSVNEARAEDAANGRPPQQIPDGPLAEACCSCIPSCNASVPSVDAALHRGVPRTPRGTRHRRRGRGECGVRHPWTGSREAHRTRRSGEVVRRGPDRRRTAPDMRISGRARKGSRDGGSVHDSALESRLGV